MRSLLNESQKIAVQAEGTGGNSTVLGKRRKKKKGEINGEESDVSD